MPRKAAEPTREILGITFFSTKKVMELTGLSRSTVAAAFRTGKLLGKKIGGVWWTTELWLDEWVSVPGGRVPPMASADIQKLAKMRGES